MFIGAMIRVNKSLYLLSNFSDSIHVKWNVVPIHEHFKVIEGEDVLHNNNIIPRDMYNKA